jgi:hypothetical protein
MSTSASFPFSTSGEEDKRATDAKGTARLLVPLVQLLSLLTKCSCVISSTLNETRLSYLSLRDNSIAIEIYYTYVETGNLHWPSSISFL